jgi:ankyrin repeat protein
MKQTPLHLAVLEDNVQIVHMLLQKRARFDIPDANTETPLSIAVTQQREACSKLMIEFGADVSVLYAKAAAEEQGPDNYDRYGFLIDKNASPHPKLDKYVVLFNLLKAIDPRKHF